MMSRAMHPSTSLSARLERLLHAAWQQRGIWAMVTRPLSWVTHALVAVRQAAYQNGWKDSTRLHVPVVVVGNIYVGGTGKTPFLQETVAQLQRRGWTPGIVSRGYGVAAGSEPLVGQGTIDAGCFGDEPALLARTTRAPVAVHPRRPLAAKALLQQFPEVDVILLDDGLQHLALQRDIEIVMQDQRGVGNGLLLPAGPLREPPSRLASVDVIVTNIGSEPFEPARFAGDVQPTMPPPTGTRHVMMGVDVTSARRLVDERQLLLDELCRDYARVAAIAGIGQPERFFASLRRAGVPLAETIALPDHFDFKVHPFPPVDADIILITEKDAVKCGHLADERIWAVPVYLRFSDPGFFDWLHSRLVAYSNTKSFPRHG